LEAFFDPPPLPDEPDSARAACASSTPLTPRSLPLVRSTERAATAPSTPPARDARSREDTKEDEPAKAVLEPRELDAARAEPDACDLPLEAAELAPHPAEIEPARAELVHDTAAPLESKWVA